MALTILVADDDLGTRLSISDYLETAGYFVVSAENGQEALKLVENYQPHLIVTDITMPQMDGWELVRQIRQRPALRLLPVVFLTARTETQERVRGYQLGCDLFLAKPFELQELGAVVRNLLERQQMIESERRFSRKDPIAAEKNSGTLSSPISSEYASEKAFSHHYSTLSTGVIDFHLTRREQEVLKVVSDGLSNVQIGEYLHLSPRTVEKYVSSLLKKTDTNNRAELVRFAMEHRLVE
ncbi:response regulator transcription factor [Kovacikia minuta CCNUW1]|uniref:response regulator transcription factor n=1 Tax=Kovacikia minuta TaxID=2931930 RepID=UPI001CCB4F0F|nr:response regulator transcription factor [Kovacikia minuta]UBF28061.1 response regulator transcription factor [Kovacikia minuta CCNUW1]